MQSEIKEKAGHIGGGKKSLISVIDSLFFSLCAKLATVTSWKNFQLVCLSHTCHTIVVLFTDSFRFVCLISLFRAIKTSLTCETF